MTLVCSGTYRNKFETNYKFILDIKTLDIFKRVMKSDHTASKFKNNHRANDNFLKSNSIMLDFDNEALPIDEFNNKYKDIEYYLATSKSHNKEKSGKIEPRYHIYLPIPMIESKEKYSLMIKATQIYFETADEACKDVSRFFYGNKESQCLYNNGKCILYFILGIYQNLKKKKETQNVKYEYQALSNYDVGYNDYTYYINKVLMNEDKSVGNRNNLLTKLAGC